MGVRIIGGSERGRKLAAPNGRITRPITDRAKESIFNMLASMGYPADATVVDLFAGTGSFGLESLSRAATSVTFVERDRAALEALRTNIATFGYGEQATVVAGDVSQFVATMDPVDLAFCDPPYPDDPWPHLLSALRADVAVLHAEHPVLLPERWSELKRRQYGRSHICIAQRHPGG